MVADGTGWRLVRLDGAEQGESLRSASVALPNAGAVALRLGRLNFLAPEEATMSRDLLLLDAVSPCGAPRVRVTGSSRVEVELPGAPKARLAKDAPPVTLAHGAQLRLHWGRPGERIEPVTLRVERDQAEAPAAVAAAAATAPQAALLASPLAACSPNVQPGKRPAGDDNAEEAQPAAKRACASPPLAARSAAFPLSSPEATAEVPPLADREEPPALDAPPPPGDGAASAAAVAPLAPPSPEAHSIACVICTDEAPADEGVTCTNGHFMCVRTRSRSCGAACGGRHASARMHDRAFGTDVP